MQQSKSQQFSDSSTQALWYFAFGPSQKSSLLSEFARQNNFKYLVRPTSSQLEQSINNIAIIEADSATLLYWEPKKSNISVIFVGSNDQFQSDEATIKTEYSQIGRCKWATSLTNYSQFRKTLYPNLIFFYGAARQHRQGAASTIAYQTKYEYVANFPKNANEIVSTFSKTKNYTFSYLFTNPNEIQILMSRFNIKIVHFKFNRNDFANEQAFFDQEYQIINYLNKKAKAIPNSSFFFSVDGNLSSGEIMGRIGEFLCPQIVFINSNKKQQKQYANDYSRDKNTVVLSIFDIQHINKRKNIPLATTLVQKIRTINSIIYDNINREQVVLSDFPWHANQFQTFENVNRKVKMFVDLHPSSQYSFHNTFSSNMYFLETQRRFAPNLSYPLIRQIDQKSKYYLVVGPQGCGKTSVSKSLESQYGFASIEYEPYVAVIKQKLIAPEDGQQLPVKKIINHFKELITKNNDKVYVIDGLQINENDLKEWIQAIGPPIVINLKVDEVTLIKRQRKKAQSDVNAEITEQDNQKAKELIQKVASWVDKVNEYSQESQIYSVDFNPSLILCEKYFTSILQPRIFLIQKNPTLIFQNIAIKHNCCFINLDRYKLSETKDIIRNCRSRNVLICNYAQTEDKLISEDLYWIQKNLGKIRYLAIWGSEEKQINQEQLELQRPVQVKKVKQVVQGQQAEEQKPAQEEGQEGEAASKKKLDIYAYEWTNPICYKNLSQWYFKLKKNIQQVETNPNEAFQNFKEVLRRINEFNNLNIYEMLKS